MELGQNRGRLFENSNARLTSAIQSGNRFESKAINYKKERTPLIMHWRVLPIKAGKQLLLGSPSSEKPLQSNHGTGVLACSIVAPSPLTTACRENPLGFAAHSRPGHGKDLI